MKCVVLCAGKGSRMGVSSLKVLLPVRGKPILHHVIDMWKYNVDSFVFVVGYQKEEVIKQLPLDAIIVVQEEQRGIADAILQVEEHIEDRFVVALGDCIQSGHFVVPIQGIEQGIGVWAVIGSAKAVKQGYSVEVTGNWVSRVVEKPKGTQKAFCGMGTYFFDRRVFDYIRRTPVSSLKGEAEITDTVQLMIDGGEKITPVFFKGRYLNITTPGDLKKAEEVLK